jgi:hypothetical protein
LQKDEETELGAKCEYYGMSKMLADSSSSLRLIGTRHYLHELANFQVNHKDPDKSFTQTKRECLKKRKLEHTA